MRRYRSKAEWASILEEYSCSGQSLEVFSRERGISPSSMYRRLRKLNCGKGAEALVPRLWWRLWCGVTFPPPFEKELRRTTTAPFNLSLELML